MCEREREREREKPLLRDREMAALVAGVQYGLSSHSNFHENKSLIFVKLTDSAQRAIEDFLRNRVSKFMPILVPVFENQRGLSSARIG